MGNQNSKPDGSPRERAHSTSFLSSTSLPGSSSYFLNSQSTQEPGSRGSSADERESRRRRREAALHNPAYTLSDFDPLTRVDGGCLTPRGTYTGRQDFYANVVAQFILERRLAPFHRGIPDYEESWCASPELLRTKIRQQYEIPLPAEKADNTDPCLNSLSLGDDILTDEVSESITSSGVDMPRRSSKARAALADVRTRVRAHSLSHSPSADSIRRGASDGPEYAQTKGSREPRSTQLTSKALLPDPERYRGAEECPICFLNYPPPMNITRCCHQPICTECFVQIKRPDPEAKEDAPGGLISTPACCPYCVVPEFGVVHEKMQSSLGMHFSSIGSAIPEGSAVEDSFASPVGSPVTESKMTLRRRPSFPVSAPEVVTTDAIRPDWSSRLRDARAAAIRRANRRFIGRVNQSGEYTYSVSRGDGTAGHTVMTARQHLQELEEQQLLEAMRLSQLDEEARLERECLERIESDKRRTWKARQPGETPEDHLDYQQDAPDRPPSPFPVS